MKIAIMQPYFCPHIGYFQLVDAVDTFVFYDDVQYIKGGYINRNTLRDDNRFTIPVSKKDVRSMKKINEIKINWENRFFKKFPKTLDSLYKNSKNYKEVILIIEKLFNNRSQTMSELACNSIKLFSEHLGIKTKFLKSSELKYSKAESRASNLINICKSQSHTHYINSIGGQKLYNKDFFADNGITLSFLDGQTSNSIIDSSMNEEKLKHLSDLQNGYKLI